MSLSGSEDHWDKEYGHSHSEQHKYNQASAMASRKKQRRAPCEAQKVMRKLRWSQTYQEMKAAADKIQRGRASKETCAQLKTSGKNLFMIYHPDKFQFRHPECSPEVSNMATAFISKVYFEARELCAFY
jgi:hypothetical protein